jgi:subtilisin family serine protease
VPNRTLRLAPLATLAALLAFVAVMVGGPLGVHSAFASAPEGRLVVTWRTDAPAQLAVDGVAAVHRSHSNKHRAVVVARAGRADEVAGRLRSDPRVASVVADAIGSVADWPQDAPPDDQYYASSQKDFPLIGVPAAWPLSTGSSKVIVAVLDTGVQKTHPDLVDLTFVSSWNTRTNTTNVRDFYGHGTHVVGTIAARANNAVGVAGLAPGVTIMPVKVMDDNGQGYWSDFLEGVDWARTHGASIVNLSLGGTLSASQAAAFQPTFDAAYNAGVLVVAAAGNNNRNEAFYPASFNHVVSVAATTNSDAKASFSNYGPNVDLSAPGVSIMSTYPGSLYKLMSGTSMATPHVVGLAALIRSYHPGYTVDEVERAMELNAVDLGTVGRDDYFGFGRIQVDQALTWVAPDFVPPVASLASPANGATGISESAHPTVGFSEDVTGADAGTVSLATAGGAPVAATVAYSAATHRTTITPSARLASRTKYVVSVADGVADIAGNPLAATSFSFTTGDHIAPYVTSVSPSDGRVSVWRGVSPRITFSEAVRHVSTSTLKLRNLTTGNLVSVKVTYDSATHTAKIDPTSRLMAGTWYRIKVLSGIDDAAGNNVSTRYFRFKTRA